MKRYLLIFAVATLLLAVATAPKWIYGIRLLSTSPAEAGEILETTIVRVLADPSGALQDARLTVEVVADATYPADLEFLRRFSEFRAAECYDFASYVFNARDWDCRVRHPDGRALFVQGVWKPDHQTIRIRQTSKSSDGV